MAFGYLPVPGKIVNGEEIGPCIEPCEHKDCAETRRMAEAKCWVCGNSIGYEIPFMTRNEHRELAHALCIRRAAGIY